MHEFSLHGTVPAERHVRFLQQLAGVTCMQPRPVEEIRLIFKSRIPPGLDKVQGSGGSQGTLQSQDAQKLRTMLQSGIYYVHLVGSMARKDSIEDVLKSHDGHTNSPEYGLKQADMSVKWTFEFKDTPESGKQDVNSRFVSRTDFEGGEMMGFLELFGYEYITCYYVEGSMLYHENTTLLVYRVRQIPGAQNLEHATDVSKLPPRDELPLLDQSGSYQVQATIDIADGNVQELRARATRQLVLMRETLKTAVTLAQVDRLALETRINIPVRRI